MKKFKIFMIALAFAVCAMFASCNSCSSNKDNPANDEITYVVDGVDVNWANDSDISWMGMHYADCEWRWLECCVDMKDFIDETGDTATVMAVANIFSVVKVIDSTSGAFTTTVILRARTADTSVTEIKENALWVGDDPMNEYNPMNIDFAHAWDRMMIANCVKPHSKHCVLRKEVGPTPNVDPIYIFGNQDAQVYVMSNTGEVTTTNPVFPKGLDSAYNDEPVQFNGTVYGPRNTRIGCPLGEWP